MKLRKLLLIASALVAAPTAARAQASGSEVESLRAEVQALKDQLAAISAKVDANEAAAKAKAAADAKKPAASEVKWKGGPETSSPDGFTFKPRGRAQIDLGVVNAPNNIVLPAASRNGSAGAK